MLTENKFSKYLLYAVGEIILVVIGILIALQINDWNGAKKLEQTNLLLMEKMQGELQINMDRLHYLDTGYYHLGDPHGYTPVLAVIDTALSYVNDGLNEKKMLWILERPTLFAGGLYNLSNAVYREMLSSGRFNTLGSDSLIKRVQLYYQLVEREAVYVASYNAIAYDMWRECKYGYENLKADFDYKGAIALEDHPWYLDRKSAKYIDLKTAIRESRVSTERNRRHAITMLHDSEALIEALQREIDSLK